jgi:hypothetical protein
LEHHAQHPQESLMCFMPEISLWQFQHVVGGYESDGLDEPAGLKMEQAQGSLLQEAQYLGPDSE